MKASLFVALLSPKKTQKESTYALCFKRVYADWAVKNESALQMLVDFASHIFYFGLFTTTTL
jgi:hypothetical protein